MTFLELYGTELDRELASSSTALFTTVKRKAAINAGQLAFVKETDCLQKQTSITIVDGTQEYDIEATVSDFGWIAEQGVSIKIVGTSSTRYIEGDDLTVTSVERLNVEEPGWRAVSAGTPRAVYIRRNGGSVYLGFHPAPDVTGSDVWTVVLPYVMVPTDMSADADEPFTVSSNPIKSLRFFHRALVHFAAFDLEKLRKEPGREEAQYRFFMAEVQKFLNSEKPKGGQVIRMARNYRRPLSPMVPVRRWDPRT